MPVDNASDGDTKGPAEVDGVEVDPLIGWCLTYVTNFSGHPSASVPAGLSGGLPVGMQIIGRRYADSDVLAAAAAVERVRPWRDAYEICMKRRLEAQRHRDDRARELESSGGANAQIYLAVRFGFADVV